jgi:histidyl-tRNA synthetase
MKPSIPKGTRDFSPVEMVRRNYIFDAIRNVFQRYGYLPIETPAMENMETLMGKYGEEGDKLIFKILNSGNFLADSQLPTTITEIDSKKLTPQISEKALRYDLTVPFARYVVQHQNEIAFPFKRYQMQPVWRADRPQKGRYREFFQCDADVIGSDSLLNEVELVQMIDEVFTKLDIPVTIKINNRKILAGIAEVIGEKEKIVDITVAIDKLDKIGVDGVNKELNESGISALAIEKLQPLIVFKGNKDEKLALLKQMIGSIEIGKKGIEEVESIFNTLKSQISNLKSQIEFDITLARGLNYYTGAIFEIKANTGTLTSSICGGGRYDDLTGIFGLPNVSGVGISFGIDRIFDVLTELNKFEKIDYSKFTTKLMFAHFGEAEQKYCLPLLAKARAAGINAELYPDVTKKISKQFDYANKKQIPFVVVVGGDEMSSGQLAFKNMQNGEQQKLSIDQIIEKLK